MRVGGPAATAKFELGPEGRPREPSTRISFVRHGHVHNPDRIFYGRLPRFGLSERGEGEVRASAGALEGAPLAAVYTSPLLRAVQTARLLLRRRPELPLRISRLLIEICTPYQGRPAAEIDALQGDVYSGIGPGFEQPEEIAARMLRFVRRIRRGHAGEHVVAVTHGDPIAFLILWACDKPLTPHEKTRLALLGIAGGYPATGSITTLAFPVEDPTARPTLSHWRP